MVPLLDIVPVTGYGSVVSRFMVPHLSDLYLVPIVSEIRFRLFAEFGSDCFRITVPVSQNLDYSSGFSVSVRIRVPRFQSIVVSGCRF
jgi:hypothetical protein